MSDHNDDDDGYDGQYSQYQPFSYPVTAKWLQYLTKTADMGAIVGEIGNNRNDPELRKLITAAHHYLAGGKFEVKITESGDAETVAELEQLITDAWADANAVNAKAGYYLIGMA